MEGDANLRRYLGERTHEVQGADGERTKYSPEAVQVAQACFEQHVDAASLSIPDIIVFASQMRHRFGRDVTKSQPTGATGTSAAKHSAKVNGDIKDKEEQVTTPTDSATTQSRGPAANDAGAVETEILYGAAKGRYVVHPVARMFPMILGQGYDELVRSLKSHGQQEDCVADGKTFLDGRNRVNALNQLGREVRVVQFAELKTGLSPAAWIMTKNLQRRHLTDDQYLAISANYLAWSKNEADRQQSESDSKRSAQGTSESQDSGETTAESQPQDAGESADTEFPPKAAENTSKRKRGRPRGNRSEAEALAKQARQSEYRARQMVKLRAQLPELATAVEEGRMTLKDAIRQLKAKASAEQSRSQPHNDVDRLTEAVAKSKQTLSKLANKLPHDRQPGFWKQVAAYANGLAQGGVGTN